MLTFARFFPLNFLSKAPWCSLVPLKFESHRLQHCKKCCRKLVFFVFPEQLFWAAILPEHRFWAAILPEHRFWAAILGSYISRK